MGPRDFLILLLLYIAVNIIRTLVIFMMFPLLAKMGGGWLTLKAAALSAFGGLRGAVGLALALAVRLDDSVVKDKGVSDRIFFHTAGIVILTLIVNAPMLQSVVKWLGLDRVSFSKRILFAHANREIDLAGKREESS